MLKCTMVTTLSENYLLYTVIEEYSYKVLEEGESIMKFAVLKFPGSNCDRDMYNAAIKSGAKNMLL